MLITMLDGGIVNYTDDDYAFAGCETCDYGSQYINEVEVTLTKYKIFIKTNQMYEHLLSEGQMIKLFLAEYNAIQQMKEEEFIEWFKTKIYEIADKSLYDSYSIEGEVVERFDVERLK